MTKRKAGLIALRDAVRDGRDADAVAINRRMASEARDRGGFWHADDVAKVIERGSLDAARALHDAVLPGFLWHAATGTVASTWFVVGNTDTTIASGTADNPARAWLLAILEALIAQETPE